MQVASWRLVCAASTATLLACGGPESVRANPSASFMSVMAGLDSLPNDPLGRAVRRGHALIAHPHDSLPAFAPSNLNCTSCHLEDGTRASAIPLTAAFARFPRFIDRTGALASIEDRVNYCFTRSLAGQPLPPDSREMREIVSYLAFLSRGVTIGRAPASVGSAPMAKLTGDSSRGRALFVSTCARCHGADGAGLVSPALWGPKSFSIGASMAREERAAAFIRHNMPFDGAATLTEQQAFDVAAFITTQPRPDLPAKERDWPADRESTPLAPI